MKKNDGVTLVVLVITIIILLIIAAISISYGISTLNNVTDERTEIELSTVQQAIAQQYTLFLSQYQNGKTATSISSDVSLESDSSRPETLIGTRIADTSTLENNGFTNYKISYSSGESSLDYEEYYYSLDEDDLETLGIEKGETSSDSTERKYIVNYSTGEVFDIANKTYRESSDEEVYVKGTNFDTTTDTSDTVEYDFNDDE